MKGKRSMQCRQRKRRAVSNISPKGASLWRSTKTHDLELDRDDSEVQKLHRRPNHEVGLQGGQIHVLKLSGYGTFSSPFGNRHKGEKASKACLISVITHELVDLEQYGLDHLPIGANISWSKATRLRTGANPAVFVRGKALDKKANQ